MENISMHRGAYDDISVHYYAPRLLFAVTTVVHIMLNFGSISDEMKKTFQTVHRYTAGII